MTCREKFMIEHPEDIVIDDGMPGRSGGGLRCPDYYGYLDVPDFCKDKTMSPSTRCTKCWDREIPEEKENKMIYAHICNSEVDANKRSFPKGVKLEPTIATDKDGNVRITEVSIVRDEPHILDSGSRREFETGAVRDIQEGKGRCDLLALDVVGVYMNDIILQELSMFQESADVNCLYRCLDHFSKYWDDGLTKNGEREIRKQHQCTMLLEVAKHFEEGCKKYGENNWQKGIPVRCYIDSAVRHYLKFLRGDKDEPHDRALCWNLICCIWTCKHKPELNDYA